MLIYRIDIPVFATAYVQAENEDDAIAQIRKLSHLGIEWPKDWDGEVPISGKAFNDPDLPTISLSPAMTIPDLSTREFYIEFSCDADDLTTV